jgi:tetratricopeptide (TPR) repeat protein
VSDTERQSTDERLEPTIVPVHRPASGGAETRPPGGSPRSRLPLIGLAALTATAGIIAVFVYLPAWVARPAPAPAPATATAVPPAEAPAPALSEAEAAALRDQAESLRAELLEQQQALDERSVSSWGDTTWSSYETAARQGDDAFLAEDLEEAVDQYRSALDIGAELIARSDSIVAEALAAGEEAIAGGNAELAASQFDLVLSIDPDNARAKRGRDRAKPLPDLLDAMRRGDALDEQGKLEQAASAYREALGIDPDWQAAKTALDDVNARIEQARFDRLIADGYAAVAAGRNEPAADLFRQALGLRPDSDAAKDGLAEAEQGQVLDAIAMAEIRAEAFERRELWNEAIARYSEALERDPTLKFAIEGLARAQHRADLDAKLEALIDAPRLLLADGGLEDAQRLLDEASAIEAPGPKLTSQKERLGHLIDLASTPIKITLVSDNQTAVTVYRVGELGTFASKELDLKPGSYTAVGQRRGFRDVRENFTVLPGTDHEPVRVVCVEPI